MATAATATDPLGYYAVLGLADDASPDDVRRAYRREAKRWHPDHNSSPDAAVHMARLNEAYETLSDPDQRAAYDRGAFVYAEPEPPRPVAYPAAVDFGTLRAGDRLTGTVRIGNAGGPFSTIRVEPDCSSWFRVSAARGGVSDDIVAELDFETFVSDDSASGPRGEVVRIFLDDKFVSVVLGARVLPAPHRTSAPPADPSDAPDAYARTSLPSWFTDLNSTVNRLALSFITGVLDPVAFIALGRHLEPGWFALLVLLAVGFFALTGYCAYRTGLFTRLDAASSEIRHLCSIVFFLGKASIVLAVVALAVMIVIAILVVLLVLAIIGIGLAIVAAMVDS